MRLVPRSLIVAAALATGAAGALAQSTVGTLDKVKASGAITVAYRESSIPFSYLGRQGEAHRLRLGDLPARSWTR